MSSLRFPFAVFFLSLGVCCRAATVPAGTLLEVRLTSEVSSNKPSGEPISGVVIAAVLANGVTVISSGVKVSGHTADVKAEQPATAQAEEKAATLRMQFTRIEDTAGHSQALNCVLAGIDNAREAVDQSSGLITGIMASETYEARIDQGLGKLSSKYEGFAQILSGMKGALLKQVDASIDYQPGVDITLKLTKALDWNASTATSPIKAIGSTEALARLVSSEPSRTVAQSPPKPSDLTNLMFIGTQEQVEGAFRAAGWMTSSELSSNSKLETARAIIENRGYSEAPMSVLYLEGAPPALTFQKQNNTFAMRHHIRIWKRPDTFDGKPVWVAAATHDTGITFSQTSHNFTHGIDSNIDHERAKVVNDLLFTGQVKAVALVSRSGLGPDLSNATGDRLQTDGAQAVLEF